MAFKFEKLRVWHDAADFATVVSEVVRNWPDEEKFNLSNQLKRAADSIALNIAEGSTGQTDKEFSRFLGMAIRSGIECVGCIILAKKRNILSNDEFDRLYRQLEDLIKGIQALRNTLR